jgi:hypothetical protein
MDAHGESAFEPYAPKNVSDYTSGVCASEEADTGARILPLEMPQNALPPQLAPQKSGASMQLLAKVVSSWAELPPQIQQAVATLVEGYAPKGKEPEVEM